MNKLLHTPVQYMIAIALIIIALTYVFSQYVAVQRHRLSIVKAITDCAERFDGDTVHLCSDVVKDTSIFKYKSAEQINE